MSHPQPPGYLAAPEQTTGNPVLVLHAWWGLNQTIKGVCDRLAAAGFVAFAPDLYQGKIASTIPDAEKLVRELNSKSEEADTLVLQATDYLLDMPSAKGKGLAVIGFSLGASYALQLASTRPNDVQAVVLFYGVGPADAEKCRAAFLGHFAENDQYEEREYIDGLERALKKAGREVTFHEYPEMNHWFVEPDRADVYDESAATLAWERTLAFLKSRP